MMVKNIFLALKILLSPLKFLYVIADKADGASDSVKGALTGLLSLAAMGLTVFCYWPFKTLWEWIGAFLIFSILSGVSVFAATTGFSVLVFVLRTLTAPCARVYDKCRRIVAREQQKDEDLWYFIRRDRKEYKNTDGDYAYCRAKRARS